MASLHVCIDGAASCSLSLIICVSLSYAVLIGADVCAFFPSLSALQTDDKQAAMAGSMQMGPFFAPPGAFFANPMMQVNLDAGGVDGGCRLFWL